MTGKILTIYGAKGGIGKTTLALNLAGVLSNMLKSVLIIDLDLLKGDIAVSLDKRFKKTILDLSQDLKEGKFEELKPYLTKYNSQISFLAAPKDPREAMKFNPESLKQMLEECRAHFDVIIIDTSHIYNEITHLALQKSDQILFITTNNPLVLKNSRNLLSIFKEEGINQFKVVLNNSIHPKHNYFVLYDIKKILQKELDYIISSKFHYSDIDIITVNGEILTIKSQKWSDYKIFTLIIKDLLK